MLFAFIFILLYAISFAIICLACRDIGTAARVMDESDVSELYGGPR